MFTNLIESSPGKRGPKSWLKLFLSIITVSAYAVVFVLVGVISIWNYDARVEAQNDTELVLMSPVFTTPPIKTIADSPPRGVRSPKEARLPERTEDIAPVDAPLIPTKVGTKASPNLPVPKTGPYTKGSKDSEGSGSGGSDGPVGPRSTSIPVTSPVVKLTEEPPPPSPPKPRAPVSKGVLNGKAISLPKPDYPTIARMAKAKGVVLVQVTIDERGNVISARVVSGHPLLQAVARDAALQARFSPTLLSNEPVKVTGIITYNFNLAP